MKRLSKGVVVLVIALMLVLSFAACEKQNDTHTHEWSDWTLTTPATESDDGEETRVCSICDETEIRIVHALGTNGLAYTLNPDKTGFEVSLGEATSTDIIIALVHNDLPVVAIADGGFSRYETMSSIKIPNSVTSIGERAFEYCIGISDITIPDSVTSIGERAFEYCIGISDITISDSVTSIGTNAFYATGIWEVASDNEVIYADRWVIGHKKTLPANLTLKHGSVGISDNSFAFCSELFSVRMPDTMVYIGVDAFYSCRRLTNLTMGSGIKHIGNSAFFSCPRLNGITISDGTEVVGDYAFAYCDDITSVVIPDSVTRLGEGAFTCSGLTSARLSNQLEGISESAFWSCANLEGITIPDSITKIAENAFANCESLRYAYLPSNITYVGKRAFGNCQNLTAFVSATAPFSQNESFEYTKAIVVPSSSVQAFEKEWAEFSSIIYSDKNIVDDDFLIKDNVLISYLGNGTSVVLPSDITSIGDYAFGRSQIKSITIPSGITQIGNHAFTYCSSLESIIIGKDVEIIGEGAFGYCDSLRVFIAGGNVPAQSGSFYSVRAIIVPAAMLSTYINSWGYYSSIILADSSITNDFVIEDNVLIKYVGNDSSVTIPKGITRIGHYAFENCKSVNSIVISDSVTSIGFGAFMECSGLKNITFGSGVAEIAQSAFDSCENLESIVVSKGNTVYKSEGNCLIEIENDTIILGCKNSIIPIGVKAIGDSAFRFHFGFTDFVIPSNITSIGNHAFYGCNLNSVTIPSTVTSIGTEAFDENDAMTVYVESSRWETDWMNDWVDSWAAIYWECELSEDKTYVVSFEKTIMQNTHYTMDYGISPPYRSGYEFGGWSITEDGATADYSTLNIDDAPNDMIYYAVWAKCLHGDAEWITINSPTCNETGLKEQHCSKCGEILDAEIIPTINHAEGEWITLEEPTCEDDGTVELHCKWCDEVLDSKTIDARAHEWSEWIATTPPTETEYGEEERTCLACGETEKRVAYATGTLGLVYTLINEDTAYAVAAGKSVSGAVVIPSYHNGLPVIGFTGRIEVIENGFIVSNAFSDCRDITSVSIPDTITVIDKFTFSGCSGLKTVILPKTLTHIEDGAFYECFSLTEIAIPNNVISIGAHAFQSCNSLINVVIPKNVSVLSEYAFYECDSLTYVAFQNNALDIGEYAFARCDALTRVILGNSIKSIGEYAFWDCSTLKSITIPNSVKSIGESAFMFWESSELTIYTEFSNHAVGWDSEWNRTNRPVFFGCTLSADKTYVVSFTKSANSINNADADISNPYRVGYIFGGWSTESGGLSATYTSKNIVSAQNGTILYAIWLENSSGHDFESKVRNPMTLRSAATCNDAATYWYSCAICGEISHDLYFVYDEPLGHDWDEWAETLAATEVLDGEESRTCLRCGEKETRPIYATGTAGLVYTDIGNAYEVSAGTATSGAVVIPYYYKGLPVTRIARDAFLDCGELTGITIPNSVIAIWENAFRHCYKLNKITIPASVVYIGNYAFDGCSPKVFMQGSTPPSNINGFYSVTFIVVPSESLELYKNTWTKLASKIYADTSIVGNEFLVENGVLISYFGSNTSASIPSNIVSIGDFAFSDCGWLTSVTIPEGVKNIGEAAFGWCSGLTNVVLPNSLINIGASAFSDCSGLTSITIPKNVTNIEPGIFHDGTSYGNSAFFACSSLASIVVASGNTVYRSEGNCLILISDNSLIFGCKNSVIPNGITSIGNNAFAYCSGLTQLLIPDSIKSIGRLAFNSCINLESLTIPNSVTNIGQDAFFNCNNLTVYSEKEYLFGGEMFNSSVFNCNLSEDKTYVISFVKSSNSIIFPKENNISNPYRKGYIFGGWTTASDGTTAEYTAENISLAPDDITLYAIWIIKN